MKSTKTLSLATAFAAMLAAPMAAAQRDSAPAPMDGQMMQGGGMMGGDMSDMQNKMGMMQQMGPMMEACTEMIQAMSDHPHQTLPDPKG
ncbi:Spy/CpxP family protein refolding chaperone [Rhodobacteraceae bacterium MBR-64]|jgi:Spy/CpxP family protein refolding chaperone